MAEVLIRDLDDALIADDKRAAAARGRAHEAELRDALTAMRPRMRRATDELPALSARLRSGTPGSSVAVDSTHLIREYRDDR